MKTHLLLTSLALGVLVSCNGRPAGLRSVADRGQEPIVGLPCEGCEAVFQGRPDSLEWSARIAPEDEPGDALRIEGTVRDAAGRTVSGVIVYAYHTDARGIYPPDESLGGLAAERHGRLRAWVETDERGRYRFDTIRPAGYPRSDAPAHVHMHVIEVGRCTYYIDDVLFEDDPRLTEAMRRQMTSGRGGVGIAMPIRDRSGSWRITRDIVLGERIPGYPER